ncbi:MAG: DEAD/DEAH box helicase, partial [Candidatus Phosphoribacter sp.]
MADELARLGILTPTPIQAATLRDSLTGRDVLGRGRTGSGKTYAFLLPVVARLTAGGGSPRRHPGSPRALIVVPTRELAGQIEAALTPLVSKTGLRSLTIFGGVAQGAQVRSLRSGVDIVIACPGRLEDLIAQGECRLDRVEITVLDEADHMSDLGFLPSVRRLLTLTPATGQRLLFSATLDAAVAVIVKRFMRNPVTHEADSPHAATLDVEHHVLEVTTDQRMPVLVDLTSGARRSVVFTRTKHGAKALARKLNAHGVSAVELHGNLAQNARTRNLAAFHSGAVSTLVATDIAARGIHVDDVELVIHADPPTEFKAYVHRSGHTARAGSKGTVVTIMERAQAQQVREMTRAAGIRPTTTAVSVGHPLLEQLVPGDRVLVPVRP